MLLNIPNLNTHFDPQDVWGGDTVSLTSAQRQKIFEHKDDIANYLAIHMLFVSAQDEKRKIIHYLRNINGLALNTSQEWFDWWLQKYK